MQYLTNRGEHTVLYTYSINRMYAQTSKIIYKGYFVFLANSRLAPSLQTPHTYAPHTTNTVLVVGFCKFLSV